MLKVTKLRKIALIPLRKKIRSSSSSGGGGCEFFFLSVIKAITAARCLLLLPRLLGVGRLAAVTVNTDHGPTELEFRTAVLLAYTGSGMLARGDTI